jgi:hypothetical protein
VSVFRYFELEALRLLLRHAVTPAQMSLIEGFAGAVDYDYTGWGYYLTISHPALPVERSIRDVPVVIGNYFDVDNSCQTHCGFAAFLGGKELMLECYPLGAGELGRIVPVPADIREQAVRISTLPIKRQCPACGHAVSLWFRYAPQRFRCRNCGAELRVVILPVGYLLLGIMVAVPVLAFLELPYLWNLLGSYTRYLAASYIVACAVLTLIGARWGTTFFLVKRGAGGDAL